MKPARQDQASIPSAAGLPVDLNEAAERERLSPAALRAFSKVVERWQIKESEALALLGSVSSATYYRWKKRPPTLQPDVLLRLSLLIGIFKALNLLHEENLADAWVQLPNRNRLFAGSTPLAFMVQGGVPALQTVRRLLDARRGG